LHKWGFSAKVPQERFVNTHLKRGRERCFQKGVQKEILSKIPEGFAIAVQRMNPYLYMM
jgi:hypothetical protein